LLHAADVATDIGLGMQRMRRLVHSGELRALRQSAAPAALGQLALGVADLT